MTTEFDSRIALVTAAAGAGIGQAISMALAREGAAVLLVDRDGEVVRRFEPTVTPEQIADEIAALL